MIDINAAMISAGVMIFGWGSYFLWNLYLEHRFLYRHRHAPINPNLSKEDYRRELLTRIEEKDD